MRSYLNIKDIAAKAGVSVATISRAINSETRSKVADKTLKRVDALIDRFGYTPTLSARNLNKTSTKTIGIIFPYFPGVFRHPYYLEILAGVADSLLQTDYQFKMILLKTGGKTWDSHDFRKGEDVDALLVTHWTDFFSSKEILESIKIPCVVINDLLPDMKTFFVCGDHISGGQQVAEYLYGLRHRRFAVLTGPEKSTDSELRFRGFQSFLKTKGVILDRRRVVRANYSGQLAYERVEEVFVGPQKPTALFCLNDEMAIGALRRLKELGMRCPQDVSVVGYDNDPHGKVSRPSLTSVNVPLYHLAAEGINILRNHLTSNRPQKRLVGQLLSPVQLVVRGSAQLLVL